MKTISIILAGFGLISNVNAFDAGRSWSAGNGNFGAAASARTYDVVGNNSYQMVAAANVTGTVLNSSLQVANASASIRFDNAAYVATTNQSLNLLGVTVLNQNQSFRTGANFRTPGFSRTATAGTATLALGVPLVVTGSITGSLWGEGSLSLSVGPTSRLSGSFGPVVQATANANGRATVWVAAAGVRGSMTLLTDRLTANANATYTVSPRRATASYDITNTFSGPSGGFTAYATVLGYEKTYSFGNFNTGSVSNVLTSGSRVLW